MAELTPLEEKLGEVLGLAMAAQDATKKVAGLVDDDRLKRTLERMNKEAAATQKRTQQVAGTFRGKRADIVKKGRETKKEATQMMRTYLGRSADGLDGFEFLTMAEAGEVGHWQIVARIAKKAKNAEVTTLAEWAIPIQEKHFKATLDGSLKLADEEAKEEVEKRSQQAQAPAATSTRRTTTRRPAARRRSTTTARPRSATARRTTAASRRKTS